MQWARRYARLTPDRRDFDRLPIRIPATIAGPRRKIEVLATDISLRGCALETKGGVPGGGPFALVLHVGDPPIHIGAAIVRYASDRVVGVEFEHIAPPGRVRLVAYLGTLFTARQL